MIFQSPDYEKDFSQADATRAIHFAVFRCLVAGNSLIRIQLTKLVITIPEQFRSVSTAQFWLRLKRIP
jgi:hypothetical protein